MSLNFQSVQVLATKFFESWWDFCWCEFYRIQYYFCYLYNYTSFEQALWEIFLSNITQELKCDNAQKLVQYVLYLYRTIKSTPWIQNRYDGYLRSCNICCSAYLYWSIGIRSILIWPPPYEMYVWTRNGIDWFIIQYLYKLFPWLHKK